MHLKTLYWAMNPHKRCLQIKNWNEPKQVKPNSQDISSSNILLTFTYRLQNPFNPYITYTNSK